jgi:hypothetical protein
LPFGGKTEEREEMGKKIRAAQASLVATFLAAAGAGAAKAAPQSSAKPDSSGDPAAIHWGDQLIRFLKIDGFPAYFKYAGFAQLAQFYKERLLTDTAAMYFKYRDDVNNFLTLYQKAEAGPLTGLLFGLEQYNKADDAQPLLDYLKEKGNLDNYAKFQKVYLDLAEVARGDEGAGSALEFFQKVTGIVTVPDFESTDDGTTTSLG